MILAEALNKTLGNNKRIRNLKYEYDWFFPKPEQKMPFEAIMDDNWEVEEEKWYHRLKEKYPNGVWCKAQDPLLPISVIKTIIVDFESESSNFIDDEGRRWLDVEPLPKEKLPASLEDLYETKKERVSDTKDEDLYKAFLKDLVKLMKEHDVAMLSCENCGATLLEEEIINITNKQRRR